ncbi:hypothetical protein I4U23_025952 [Adineta vaga]|nr:hypothetical protein I4U23_025952 [Adineta vaga]
MGCRHSSSPPNSPTKIVKNAGPIALKKKILFSHTQKLHHQKSNHLKTSSPIKTLDLEQILDGDGKNLMKRFEFTSTCLLYDISSTHILLFDNNQFHLIDLNTMNIKTCALSMDIQEIVWSTQLNRFLILTTDQLYQTDIDQIQLKPIHQIQFTHEGPRKSFMTVNGNDLIINRSFGSDVYRYSLTNYEFIQSLYVYKGSRNICITTIQLNSNKILALAISIQAKQMIDLVQLSTEQILHRIQLDSNENLSYPIDLHVNGYWFAKTSIPNVNIGHCLITSDGQILRLKLFSHQDNFIRSLRINDEKKWLLVGRQYALELYSL